MSVIRRIPLFIRLKNRQKMTNLVTIPPNPKRIHDETLVTYMGGYMFTLLAIMSWLHHRDITYHSKKNEDDSERIRYLEERIRDLESKQNSR